MHTPSWHYCGLCAFGSYIQALVLGRLFSPYPPVISTRPSRSNATAENWPAMRTSLLTETLRCELTSYSSASVAPSASNTKSACGRIKYFDARVHAAVVSFIGAAGHQYSTITQRNGIMFVATRAHTTGWRKATRCCIVDLRSTRNNDSAASSAMSAYDQHPSIAQSNRRMTLTRFLHRAGCGKALCARIVNLGAGKKRPFKSHTANNEHTTVRE